jgi:TonB-linked SusC/RagA family outer membrane protein
MSITVKDGTFYDVVKQIEKQSDFLFFYKNEEINDNQRVSLVAKNKLLFEILDELLKDQGLGYRIIDKHVIITKAPPVIEQQGIQITGTVVDVTGEPIIGANIVEKNVATNGTVTDADGNFSLDVAEDAVLQVSYIGYITQEISVLSALGVGKSLIIKLLEDTQALEEVVVTALGIKRSEKVLSYAVQKVSGDQFETVKGVNLATSLTGRISGMTVFNSTEFMESPTIRLRGEAPILILDGVPSSLSMGDLNQDDILSIDVLKGATASALYGSRGGNGAIMITTKKGGKKGFSVTLNTSNMANMGELALPEAQTSYSSGIGGVYNAYVPGSGPISLDYVWGAKLDAGNEAWQWDPIAKEWRMMELTSKGKNNFKNFLEPSFISNTTVSVTQQGENGSLRSSLSYIHNKGQYPNARSQHFRYTLGGEMKLGSKVSIEGTMGYTKQTSPNISGFGYTDQGYIYGLLVWMGVEYDITQFRDYWIKPGEVQNWHYNHDYDNPYMAAYEKLLTIDRNKLNGMFSVNCEILPWMKAILRSGADLNINQTQKRAPIGIFSTRTWGGSNNGYFEDGNEYAYTVNNDLILSINKQFDRFSVEGLLGGSIYLYRGHSLVANTTNGLSVPEYYSLRGSVGSVSTGTGTAEKQMNSLFGKVTLGYANAFYADLTGRNDWSSTLPSNENSYFYPSVGGSIILSELIPLPEWLPFWKLRGSWTVTKSDLGIYALNQAYGVSNNVWNGLNTASYPLYIRGNVKPISNRTWEAGTAVWLLPNNRLKLDLAYFNKLTYNSTAQVNISPFSGYEQKLVNTEEEYVRKGVEITLDAVPVKIRDFAWNLVLNWSTSKRYYARLDDQYSADRLWIAEGSRTDHLIPGDKEFQRDPQGNIINGTNGFPIRSQYDYVAGYADPDWVWGLANTFRYKNFTLNVTLDGRTGGMSQSVTNMRMGYVGSHPDTDNQYRYEEVVNGNKTYIGEGVKIVSGTVEYDSYGQIVPGTDSRVFEKNDVVVSYESYMRSGAWRYSRNHWLDETFFKLRELSLTYDVPAGIAGKAGAEKLSVALVGQNLLLWTKKYKYADPDKHSEDLASPSVRYLGVNLKVEF